jgi:predicted ATPase
MKPPIRSLILKRYRSILSDSVDFDNPTVLVGRNGAGKSNLVDALAFLGEAMALPLQVVFDRRGGIAAVRNRSAVRSHPPNLGLCVSFGTIDESVSGGRYAFEVRALADHRFDVLREQCIIRGADNQIYWFNRTRKKFSSNVPKLETALDPACLAMPVVGDEEQFAPFVRTLASMRAYCIEPAKLREMQSPDAGLVLDREGGNAASVLAQVERRSPADAKRVCELLEAIVPNTKRVQSIKHGNKLSLEFTQPWGKNKRLTFEPFSMSDGTLRALGVILAVFQCSRRSLVAIEEPEAGLHPGVMSTILDLLHKASERMQIVVSTHSPEALDARWLEGRHLRAITWQEGVTRVTPLPQSPREALREHLLGTGDLARNGVPDAKPLFVDDAAQPRLFDELG